MYYNRFFVVLLDLLLASCCPASLAFPPDEPFLFPPALDIPSRRRSTLFMLYVYISLVEVLMVLCRVAHHIMSEGKDE